MPRKAEGLLRTKGVVIDLARLEKDLEAIEREVKIAAIQVVKDSLQAQIDAIRAQTANRLSEVKGLGSIGTQNDPLEGAVVASKQLRGVIVKNEKFTSRRAGPFGEAPSFFVKHQTKGNPNKANLFNILDTGTKDRTASANFAFPRYKTPILTAAARAAQGSEKLGNPNELKNLFSAPTSLVTSTKKKGKKKYTEVDIVGIKAGTYFRGFEGLNLYEAAAKHADKIINDRGFTIVLGGVKEKVFGLGLLIRVKATKGIKP